MSASLLVAGLIAGLSAVPAVAADDGDPPSARELLASMADAYETRSFSGRFLYLRAGELSTLALERAVIDGRVYERMTGLQGPASEVIRNDGRTVSVHPDDSMTLLSSGVDIAPLETDPDEQGSITRHYAVHFGGHDRVAGRDAWRVRLDPRDQHRYGYRFWLDQQSGLLLKSEILNGQHSALERVEFVSLNLEPGLDPEHFALPETPEPPPADEPEQQGREIRPRWLPDGFSRAARDRHRLQGRTGVLRSTTYSDGLSAFTLFVEPAPSTQPDGDIRRQGPTVVLARPLRGEGRNYQATLVGEIPAGTARRVLERLSLEPADD